VIIPDAGHFIFIEAAAVFRAEVLGFLQQPQGGAMSLGRCWRDAD
jgi:hypothetical protein